MRIICGAKKGTSHEALYNESKLQRLNERRTNQSLAMLYKMIRHETPQTLSDLLPQRTGNRSEYNTRNSASLIAPRSRSTAHYESFLPSTCRDWNNLPDSTKNCNDVAEFKAKIRGEVEKPPKHFYIGNRLLQIIHCQMRVGNCNLNNNLHSIGLADSA